MENSEGMTEVANASSNADARQELLRIIVLSDQGVLIDEFIYTGAIPKGGRGWVRQPSRPMESLEDAVGVRLIDSQVVHFDVVGEEALEESKRQVARICALQDKRQLELPRFRGVSVAWGL